LFIGTIREGIRVVAIEMDPFSDLKDEENRLNGRGREGRGYKNNPGVCANCYAGEALNIEALHAASAI
jgi:hypothetical protein